ncbi:Alpha/beta hydrolase family protein [Corynebacterium occultum]|uniref:Alpha/beta hydrolase family protein n=1 Tax=Corynebacterium occultum TaxID=2675219 RepID=A0A6B8W6V9_9CORY|nr:alpha/beta hydrolase [Corynebacterium occultum]QGU08361.1 Alpha/beta hydrolase family protein [Corynebacterium occultum]
MSEYLILLPGTGQLPEVWTEVVNALPPELTPKIPLLRGSLAEQEEQLFDYVQKNELGYFHLVGHESGAMVALRYAAANPRRVNSLTLSDLSLSFDPAQLKGMKLGLKMTPGFLLRRRGVDKQKMLNQLAEAAALDLSELAGDLSLPVQVLAGTQGDALAREAAGKIPGASYQKVESSTQPWFREYPEILVEGLQRLR